MPKSARPPVDLPLYREALKSALAERDAAAHLRKLRRAAAADRLSALPDLKVKLASDTRKLRRLTENGLSMRSSAIARFERSGVRLTPEQIYAAIVKDAKAKIAALRHEIDCLEEVLHSIRDDPYFATINDRFLERLSDGFTAKSLGVDPSTVRRQRVRLLNQIALRLDGLGE